MCTRCYLLSIHKPPDKRARVAPLFYFYAESYRFPESSLSCTFSALSWVSWSKAIRMWYIPRPRSLVAFPLSAPTQSLCVYFIFIWAPKYARCTQIIGCNQQKIANHPMGTICIQGTLFFRAISKFRIRMSLVFVASHTLFLSPIYMMVFIYLFINLFIYLFIYFVLNFLF